jgi:hypothetical protein
MTWRALSIIPYLMWALQRRRLRQGLEAVHDGSCARDVALCPCSPRLALHSGIAATAAAAHGTQRQPHDRRMTLQHKVAGDGDRAGAAVGKGLTRRSLFIST